MTQKETDARFRCLVFVSITAYVSLFFRDEFHGSHGDASNYLPTHFVRLLLVEDLFGHGKPWPNENYDEGTNMFSGLGGIIPSDDADPCAKSALNFDQVTPKCTRFVQPINRRRYRILWQKRIKIGGRLDADSDGARVGKWWIPYKKTVKFSSMGTGENTTFTTPQVKFLWFQENSAASGAPAEHHALTMDLKWLTYFKNK